MKINSITVEKLNYLLKEFETNIEIKNVDGKLFLRNKYWEKIKDVKIYNSTEKITIDKDLYFVSVDDRSFLKLKNTTLESAFPMPSSLENPEYSLADFALIH